MAKVHRKYRHSWVRGSREITEREQQAMYNFYLEGRSPWRLDVDEELVQRFCTKETLARHFSCSIADVSRALERPWIQPRKVKGSLGRAGSRWWESNHSDPLELVKLYYPAHIEMYYSDAALLERQAEENKRSEAVVDPESWLEERWGPSYVSDENIQQIQKTIDKILLFLEKHEPEKLTDSQAVIAWLDKAYNVNQ